METVQEIVISTHATGDHPFLAGVLGQRIRHAAVWWRIVGIYLTRTSMDKREVHYVLQACRSVGGQTWDGQGAGTSNER